MLVYHGSKIRPDVVTKAGGILPLNLASAQKAVVQEFRLTENRKFREAFSRKTLLPIGEKKKENNVVWVTRDYLSAHHWAETGSNFWNLLRLEAFGLIDYPFFYPRIDGYIYHVDLPMKYHDSAVDFMIPKILAEWVVDVDEVKHNESTNDKLFLATSSSWGMDRRIH